MARRRTLVAERAEWHKTARGCWSLSLGTRGLSVRVEQRKPGGIFHRAVWLPDRGWTYKTLKTVDRSTARELAERFLEELQKTGPSTQAEPEPLTLKQLIDRYQQEAPGYRTNTKRTRDQKISAAERIMAALGSSRLVSRLTSNDIDRYIAMRRTGSGWPDGRRRDPVRANAVRNDLALLRTMILWAVRERRPDGSWLLAENPIRGMKVPREEDPMRPVATYDRFQKLRRTAQELATSATQERMKQRWWRLELALVLAEATGRRIGSIRGLRWSDVTAEPASIRWRAEFDKRGRERTVPIPQTLADEIHSFQLRLKGVGDGWVFQRETKDGPWARETFGQLLALAELKAQLPSIKGGRWHAFRRKWATERKNQPMVDVMAAGGWRDLRTLTTSYQQADDETMLQVMSSPVKLMSRKTAVND